MISIETTTEGFTLFVDGRKVLTHTSRRPCIEIGSVKESSAYSRGAAPRRPVKYKRIRLKSFAIEEATPEQIVVTFEGQMSMTARNTANKLRLAFSGFGDHINRFRFRLEAFPKETLMGCGERYGRLNLKGRRIPLWVEDRCGGRGICPVPSAANLRRNARTRSHSTSFPLPAFLSSRKYWVHVAATSYCVFDFTNPRVSVLELWQVPKEIVLGFGETPAEIVAGLSRSFGRPLLPPSWTRAGACLGVQGGILEVRRKIKAARDAGARISAVCVQDWCGRRTSRLGSQTFFEWKADDRLYPELPSFISELKTEGVRFLGYINPFLAMEGRLYAEAHDKGFCVRNEADGDYMLSLGAFPFAIVDLTNPRAFRWIKDVILNEMIKPGMSGWLADFGDGLPDDVLLYDGKSSDDINNRWPLLWAKANREAVEEAGKSEEIMTLVRSGWSGSSMLASGFWAGSQLTDFDIDAGLASVIPAGISAGMGGAGFWHSDVGGCSSRLFRSRKIECLKRWAELAAFTPMFRTHEGCRPEANAQCWTDQDVLLHFARMTEIYSSLEPYHEVVAREYVETGLPPVRHLWTHYGDDEEVRRIEREYLYGRDLLVAPVVEKGKILQQAYLPQDRWVHLWSSRTFRGGDVILEAPLGYPLVFYRENSRFAPLFDTIRRNARKV